MDDFFLTIKNLVFSKTAKDIYIVFVGNIVSFFFGIIFAILAARAIEPSGWGIFSAAGGLMVILFAFSELGLSSGLFKFVSGLWSEGKKREVDEVASVILTTRLITALVFSVLMIIFSKSLSGYFLKTDNSTLIYFTAFGLIGSLLIDFQVSFLQAKRIWLTSSALIALTNFFRMVFLLIFRFFGIFDISILFAVFFFSPVVTFLVSLLFERPTLSFSPKFLTIFKKVSKFSLWMGVNRSVGSISSRVDSILLIQLAGSFEAGIVGAARQLPNAVTILIASFATVIATRLASYKSEHLIKYYRKTVLLSLLLGFGVLIGVVLVGPIISLLGPKYGLSAGVLKWLLVGLIPFALSNPSVNALIYTFHKPRIIALLSVIQLPLIILGNIILIPKFGIYGPVIVIGIWNLSTLVVTGLKAKWELSHIH
ncbi:MAG: Polysaccharide biosynthesis protein [Candidatus Woesebacteria bacterium GW2011_GWB1_41_10]|uniref:Polysaccharide biosynthesis protein n=1 Tax=Candidatus Woesebacteria bacterium GW2011_GWB1_41_10 TaxID=1618577 RepID=A0A0G0UAW1_9BACT|nr:MAG: Polysaccharide biosynthesis protein [Candidatus Woesebacteria bacterium GW2011_GWB1_41_10]